MHEVVITEKSYDLSKLSCLNVLLNQKITKNNGY
jgi:hypothetical protein